MIQWNQSNANAHISYDETILTILSFKQSFPEHFKIKRKRPGIVLSIQFVPVGMLPKLFKK